MAEETQIKEIISFLKDRGYEIERDNSKMVFKKGIKITLNKVIGEIEIIKGFPFKTTKHFSFDQIKHVELISTEKFGVATPFEDGYLEYNFSIKAFLDTGKVIALFNFVDRNPEIENVLKNLVSFIKSEYMDAA